MPLALARLGANATAEAPLYDYRYCLREAPLVWLAADDPDTPPRPEIHLLQPEVPPLEWKFTSHLLNAAEEEDVFCLEPASYRRIADLGVGAPQLDYDGDTGETILFGNGAFGAIPGDGDLFEVAYRVGAGARGNVAADSITVVDPVWAGLILSVSNPFPASGGADRETNEQIRRRAPQAFQARQFRAVRAEDYEAEVERLDWVQQAGTAFRWTGSWFTAFTAVDPKGGDVLPLDRHTELIHLLNRRRLAGYESYVPPARYVSIDLAIELCAKPEAFRGDVERDVLNSLAPAPHDGSATGFFFADHFTFGTPFERSRIESAIQSVPGVAGVLSIRYRRRGFVPNYVELPGELPLAIDEILRIDNDPNHPERGAVAVNVCGGK
jgi:predicted phage baseplate assembly protein